MEHRIQKSATEYTIGWITALPIERAAAVVMLEEQHDEPTDFQRNPSDENSYEWGCIRGHNIVIASLPAGSYGTISAVSTSKNMLASLPNIKLGLLIGIGAGVPNSQHDIRLGDVVVSQPEGQHGGVIQYDLGKSKAGGEWELKGSLASPPKAVLHTLAMLQAKHEVNKPLFIQFLNTAIQNNARWGSKYARPDPAEDRLFKPDTLHKDDDCFDCGAQIERKPRQSTDPELHYGTIASGNTLVKDGKARDEIVTRAGHSCICLEMEAAGLIDSFPCLVVRGICDYADAHKNDIWQRYASATAAAFTKELLHYLPVTRINQIEGATDSTSAILHHDKAVKKEKDIERFLQSLYMCPYAERKDRNYEAAHVTCQWFLNHTLYKSWQDGKDCLSGLLWVSADAGCGKSVLARHLIDKVFSSSDQTLLYWFFKDDFPDQKTLSSALLALLHQLFTKHRWLISDALIEAFANRGSRLYDDVSWLWSVFERTISEPQIGKIVCVIDALDECINSDRQRLIKWIISLFSGSGCNHGMKMILTSRHYGNISDAFYAIESKFPNIHLDGDNETESSMIADEISLVIGQRVKNLSEVKNWSLDVRDFMLQKLLSMNNRTYLWVHLTMEYIANTFYTTKAQLQQAITTLPSTVDEAYDKILSRSIDPDQSRIVLAIIVAVTRPLTLYEMSRLLALGLNEQNYPEVQEVESERNCKINIRNLCGLFIVVRDSQIFLLHQTAREFLIQKTRAGKSAGFASFRKRQREKSPESISIWKHCLPVPQTHRVIAERCIWFLLTYSTEPSQSRYEKHKELWRYCTMHWMFHFKRADFDRNDSTTEHALLLCNTRTNKFWTWYLDSSNQTTHGLKECPSEQAHESCALLTPAALGLTPVVELLLERGTSEVWKSHALWWATYNGHKSVALLLLEHDTDPNIARYDVNHKISAFRVNGTPLHNAIAAKDEEMISALCVHGAKVDDRAFQHAVERFQNEAVIRQLINQGAKVDSRTKRDESALSLFQYHSKGPCPNYKHSSAMFDLLWNGQKSVLEQQSIYGNHFIHHAAQKGCTDCVKFLLEQQISIDVRSEIDATPLMAAVHHGQLSTTELLLESGADLSATNSLGRTPLMVAVASKVSGGQNLSTVKKLLEYDSRINVKNKANDAAIHIAAWRARYNVIEVLLSCGADVNAKGARGDTALIMATRELSASNERQRTVSDLDSLKRCIDILLAYGADGSIKNDEGKTALDYPHGTS